MASAASLALWGIVRPAEVIEIAAGAGLDVAIACTLLDKESAGGKNVWGHDGVLTGGFYNKGDTVTRAAYDAWKPHRGTLGSQGVGPCQLTYPPLQDQADRLGGCWDWSINVTVGFRHLAGLMKQYGTRDGFRRYNGSGAAADAYAADAMNRLAKWIVRVGNGVPAISPTVVPLPTVDTTKDDDMAAIPFDITPNAAFKFQAARGCEAGGGSSVASSGWVTFGSTYGGTTWTVGALGADSTQLGYWKDIRTGNNKSEARQLPPGTRAVTVEGVADNEGTRPWATAWALR